LNVTPQRFRQFDIEPHARIGRAPWYSLPDLAAFNAERTAVAPRAAVDGDASERLKELKVDELELDLAERRGELAHFSSFQSALDTVLLELASRFNAVPQAVADSVMTAAAKGDREAVVRIIEDGINGAREVVADLRIPIVGVDRRRSDDREDPAAAAASNGSGLGGSEPRSIA
jgi:hypothetical protein